MYWIDSTNGDIIHSVTDSTDERAVIYNDKIRNIIKNKNNLITIHTHPSSLPPSVSDFNSNFKNNYKLGVVACHDGKIFVYSSNQFIEIKLFDLYIGQFISEGCAEYEAQIKALDKLKISYDIDYKEVRQDE